MGSKEKPIRGVLEPKPAVRGALSSLNASALESLLSSLTGLGALGNYGPGTNTVDFRAEHVGSFMFPIVRSLQVTFSWPSLSV